MILPDTTIWIEFFRGREPYFTQLAERMENGEVIAVEWIFGEILQGTRDAEERRVVLSYWSHLPRASLERGEVWIRAGIYAAEEKFPSRGVGLIDAAILIAAEEAGAHVWTLDKKLTRTLPEALRFRG